MKGSKLTDDVHRNSLSGWVFFDETPSFEVATQRIPWHQGETVSPFLNGADGVSCAVIGCIHNLAEVAQVEVSPSEGDTCVIAKIFESGGLDAVSQLEGIYTIFIFDGRNGKGYIFQDDVGSNIPLYFTRTSRGIRFSTRLRNVLKAMPAPREPDIEACFDALLSDTYYSANVIPNHRTLVRNVHKIMPETCLEIDVRERTSRVRPFSRIQWMTRFDNGDRNLLNAVDTSMTKHVSLISPAPLGATLSSGYDTNYLLHRLRKETEEPLTAFSVGGKKVNEIGAASNILKEYDDVSHVTSTLEPSIIEKLPDIIWRLEGYEFQSGIFLQYELGRLVSEAGFKSLIVGEGADQFLNWTFYSDLSWAFQRTALFHFFKVGVITKGCDRGIMDLFRASGVYSHIRSSASREIECNGMLDYILKKSGILLNSYGVQAMYPFLSRRFRRLGMLRGPLTAWSKSDYKEQVKKRLGPKISSLLQKIGGTTDVEYLVRPQLPAIVEVLKKSRLISKLITPAHLDLICQRTDLYWHLLMQLLSLDIFDTLFLSGDYDELFDEPSLSMPLTHHLKPDRGRWQPDEK